MTEASHEKCARCNGDGFYFRVPDNFNPFLAGGFATARAAYKVTCSRVIAPPAPVSKDSGVSVEQLGEPVCLVHPAGHQPCSQILAEGLVGSVPHSPPVSVSDDDISCSTAHAADAYPASTPMSTAKLEDQP